MAREHQAAHRWLQATLHPALPGIRHSYGLLIMASMHTFSEVHHAQMYRQHGHAQHNGCELQRGMERYSQQHLVPNQQKSTPEHQQEQALPHEAMASSMLWTRAAQPHAERLHGISST